MSAGLKKGCLIVGGSPQPSSLELVRALATRAAHIIAVDRGAEVLRAARLLPATFVGDADSVSKKTLAWVRRAGCRMVMHPVIKDATDLTLALAVVRAQWRQGSDHQTCVVSCVSGGRIDHQLAVVGALAKAKDLAPVIVEDSYRAWILSPQARAELCLDQSDVGKTLSVLSLCNTTRISEQGLFWELDHAQLGVLDDLGVSNVVVSKNARVLCHQGVCLVTETTVSSRGDDPSTGE